MTFSPDTPQGSGNRLRVAVIGVGSFGRNHARVYSEMQKRGEAVELAGVCDANPERAAELAMEFRTQAFTSLEQMLSKARPQAASVCVPTIHHAAIAQQLMEAGVDVLIEKPVTASLAEADALIRLARSKQRTAMVGHLERFNPAVRAVQQVVTSPMFFEVHRLSVFTPRALDVDVVLDLMIHDLDVVLSIVDSPVKEIRAVGLPILSPKVDIANVRVEFDSGCVANFTASRVSTERVRKLRFFQPRQYVSVDYAKQDVFAISVDPAAMTAGEKPLSGDAAQAEALAASLMANNMLAGNALAGDAIAGTAMAMAAGGGMLPFPGLQLHRPEVQKQEPLMAELREFIAAINEKRAPLVPLEAGRKALALALDITAAMQQHARRAGLERFIAQ